MGLGALSVLLKSVKKNYIYNLIYQILTLIIPLITAPYLARVLNPDGTGKISYVESIVSYFTLFAGLGIAIFGQREIAYKRNNEQERSIVFWELQALKTITALITLLAYLGFSFLFADKELMPIHLVFSLQIISVAIDIVWFFQGLEEFGKIILRNLIIKAIQVTFIFVFVKTEKDLILYSIGYVGTLFLSAASIWGYLPKYITKVSIKKIKPFRNIKAVLSLFVPTIAIQIYVVLDKTMIGVITQDNFQNGYYEQAMKIARIAVMFVTALGTVMIPRIGYHYNNGEKETVKSLMYGSYRFVWLLGIPICLGLFMIADNMVPWFFGKDYLDVIPLLKILSLLTIAIGINTVTGNQFLIPTKREKAYTITVVVGACVNFALNIVFIYYFKAIGAAIASVLAETVIATLQLILVRKELSIGKIIASSIKYIFAGIVMCTVLYFENKYLTSSLLNTLIMICSGALIYFGALLLMKDRLVLSSIKSIFVKLSRKDKKKGEEMKYDYLIVGAGLYGAVLAQQTRARGKKVLVVDKRQHVGGNAYTENIEGINVHKYGAHIFHTNNKKVWDYINQFADFNRFTNAPIANYNGELYSLPFNMYTFNKMWGVVTPQQAQEKIEEQRVSANITVPKNLEEQAISLVGIDVYVKLVKGYTEKQWGRACKELPTFIIKRLPVRFTFDNNYFNAVYQGIPIGGYTKLVENMLDGVDVRLGVDYLKDKEQLNVIADKIIYTGAIDEYFGYCYGCLEYRSVRFENEILNVPNFQGNAVINYTDAKTPFTRIIEHKWFEFGVDENGKELPQTVISREYSAEWKVGDEPYYPINDDKNEELFEKYKSLSLNEKNVVFGGRLGEYKYYDMDQAIASALTLADSLFKANSKS